LAAKRVLRYPPVTITGEQAVAVVAGFRRACEEAGYRIHACAVLPEHVHLVVGVHTRDIRTIIGHMKSRATRALKERGLWANDNRPLWSAHGWNAWLEDEGSVQRAIEYVEQNPLKEGKRPQRWSIVAPFDLELARQVAISRQAPRRRIGGAALKSREGARRKRRG
jgi:REP element-mobilizing transposase RayT